MATSEDPTTADDSTTFDEGRVSHAIFQLARAHRGYAATLLRRLGLHPGQELILMHLFARDGQTQSELLASIGLDHSTLSKALRRMQEGGLLTREPAAHDRRVLVVRLTEQGSALRGPIREMWQSLEKTTVANLSAQQADALTDAAQAVVDAINDHTRTHEPTEEETS